MAHTIWLDDRLKDVDDNSPYFFWTNELWELFREEHSYLISPDWLSRFDEIYFENVH